MKRGRGDEPTALFFRLSFSLTRLLSKTCDDSSARTLLTTVESLNVTKPKPLWRAKKGRRVSCPGGGGGGGVVLVSDK